MAAAAGSICGEAGEALELHYCIHLCRYLVVYGHNTVRQTCCEVRVAFSDSKFARICLYALLKWPVSGHSRLTSAAFAAPVTGPMVRALMPIALPNCGLSYLHIQSLLFNPRVAANRQQAFLVPLVLFLLVGMLLQRIWLPRNTVLQIHGINRG